MVVTWTAGPGLAEGVWAARSPGSVRHIIVRGSLDPQPSDLRAVCTQPII